MPPFLVSHDPDQTQEKTWMYIPAQSRRKDQTIPVDPETVGYLFELNRRTGQNDRLTGVIGDTFECDIGDFEYVREFDPPFIGWRPYRG